MQYTVDGLVIRESDAGENDKRLVLLTPDRGRISVLAKGARSLKSRYMNSTALFTYGNYEITERGEHAWLSGASVIESFYGIRNDIERLALASYIVDVVYELSGESEGACDMLRLALNTLFAIANDYKPRPLIKAVFEFRAMTMSGYLPNLEACSACGKTRGSYMYLDVMNGEMKCAECLHTVELKKTVAEDEIRDARILSPLGGGALAAARYIIEAPIERLLSFHPEDITISELARMSETYLLHHLERSFSSLDFYRNVTKM
ncbi:MAG: DNA repair protein RecO [Clostridia bacterium]|nr:DNA repair protein RecO [Clostridia bacterium]